MEKGISRYWTPEAERYYQRVLSSCQTFAQRDLAMTIRDLLKYDQRTKAGKRAIAQARLRLVSATDDDIEEMASLQVVLENSDKARDDLPMSEWLRLQEEQVEKLKKMRDRIKERGVKRSDLECR